MTRPAICIYVQHLMGIGHQRRMAAISRACVRAGLDVSYVSGGMPVRGLRPDADNFVQLDPCRSPNLNFDSLVDVDGHEVSDGWCAARAAELVATWRARAHQLLLIETFPFGRKLMRFELLPLMAAAKGSGALLVSSVRDIVDFRPKRNKYQVMADTLLTHFDAALVHSDPAVLPFEESFPATPEVAHLLHYTGYVDEHYGEQPALPCDGSNLSAPGVGEVIVSAGGGGYGEHLLRCALQARELGAQAHRTWRVLVGENLSEERFLALRDKARAGVIVERARADFRVLLTHAHASISQGGYNTTMDLLASGVAAVVVAYHDATEREQLLRAEVLARRGLVTLLANSDLAPASLAASLDAAVSKPRVRCDLHTDGAARSAALLRTWIEAGQCHRES
jgi:predicted glycosyltransferase